MMRNNLTMIGNRYFTGLAGLETLHLKSNQIATIEPEALLPLTSLEFLDLSFNLLDHLYGFDISGLNALMILDVRKILNLLK